MKGSLVAVEDEFDEDLTECDQFGHQHVRTLYEFEGAFFGICNDCGEEVWNAKSDGRSL